MSLINYVNIKQGTASEPRFSAGNTLPLVQVPFGMAAFAPETERNGSWYYQPGSHSIEGIRMTHQPSPWIGDHGSFLMVPQNDVIASSRGGVWGGHRPKDDVMTPSYLKIKFLRSNCTFELTPSERGGIIRLSFGDDRKSCLTFLPILLSNGNENNGFEIDEKNNRIIGWTGGHEGDLSVNFRCWYVVKFRAGDVDFKNTKIVNGQNPQEPALHVFLNTRSVEAKIGTSYISAEQAQLNLDKEISYKGFDALLAENNALWESYLSRIEVETETEEQKKTFYTNLWRTFLYPHKAYELDSDNNPIHYTPIDGKVRSGIRYTDNGFWDTCRTVYPLYTLVARDEFADMLKGFVIDYKECGWLPRWTAMGEVGCMPSTLIDAVIALAVTSGIGDRETWELALDGMLNHANHNGPQSRFGRNGCEDYLKYGYVPRDVHGESVNLTLDAAFGDWCIATVAKALGRDELVDTYMKRSKNYANIFDAETGFMRGRAKDGSMADGFDPTKWGGEYTEAAAWQTTFFVPHDFDGLAELFGGKDKLLAKLDELFSTAPAYRVFGYGGEIHEMTEAAALDNGQFAICNQPSFHLPYIYAYFGQPEKAYYWVKKVCDESFTSEPDGFPGDEDNGTMAAWYVFACLGMYPLNPASKDGFVKIPKIVKSAKVLGKEI